ncbi:unnamed protein product [Paramecium octaurelia]|uniref:Uncharacterized protein n=1 Tax=Paramecium octaurelia TaxID=43137 RepID=A0A8S1UD73_PAROT|nr:unnamed protein product [Paramecium octaurelia]
MKSVIISIIQCVYYKLNQDYFQEKPLLNKLNRYLRCRIVAGEQNDSCSIELFKCYSEISYCMYNQLKLEKIINQQ